MFPIGPSHHNDCIQPSVRKTHCNGRKHKENVRVYYQKWLEEQVQQLVDDTSKGPWKLYKIIPKIQKSLDTIDRTHPSIAKKSGKSRK